MSGETSLAGSTDEFRIIGCIAIIQQATGNDIPLHQGSLSGFALNLLPLLYAVLISEALLHPLESKLRNADSIPQ